MGEFSVIGRKEFSRCLLFRGKEIAGVSKSELTARENEVCSTIMMQTKSLGELENRMFSDGGWRSLLRDSWERIPLDKEMEFNMPFDGKHLERK